MPTRQARAEIAIRIDDTLLEIVLIGPGERFTIGSRPGVGLGVAGINEFPLVEARGTQFVVRAPIGLAPALRGDEHVLAAGSCVALRLGLADVVIRLVAVEHAELPRPLFELRPAAYLAAVCAAEVALWATAAVLAPFAPRITPLRPRLVANHAVGMTSSSSDAALPSASEPHLSPPVPFGDPHLAPRDPSAVSSDDASPHPHPASHDRSPDSRAVTSTDDAARIDDLGGTGFAQQIDEAVTAFDTIDIAGKLSDVGPIYREYEAPGFGRMRHFDPTTRPDLGTIATGRYQPISTGHGAGADYDVTVDHGLTICASPGCTFAGAFDRPAHDETLLRRAIAPKLAALAECRTDHHGHEAFALAPGNGHLSVWMPSGVGDAAFVACATPILAELDMPPTDSLGDWTIVVPIAF